MKELRELMKRFHNYLPDAVIVGHNDLDLKKSCPYYSPVKEFRDLLPK